MKFDKLVGQILRENSFTEPHGTQSAIDAHNQQIANRASWSKSGGKPSYVGGTSARDEERNAGLGDTRTSGGTGAYYSFNAPEGSACREFYKKTEPESEVAKTGRVIFKDGKKYHLKEHEFKYQMKK